MRFDLHAGQGKPGWLEHATRMGAPKTLTLTVILTLTLTITLTLTLTLGGAAAQEAAARLACARTALPRPVTTLSCDEEVAAPGGGDEGKDAATTVEIRIDRVWREARL